MNCIKMFFFCAAVIAYNTSNAQDRNSFLIKLDSIEIDIYNNVDFDIPNEIGVDIPPLKIDLNNLPEPTIYIIDGKATNYGKYSDFSPTIDKIDSIEIIKNPAELKNRGFDKYKSAVIITTKKE